MLIYLAQWNLDIAKCRYGKQILQSLGTSSYPGSTVLNLKLPS